MHSLPETLYPTFLRVASDCGVPVFRRGAPKPYVAAVQQALWTALSSGDIEALGDALNAGALAFLADENGRFPLQALDAFERVDAAFATVPLVVAGCPFDVSDPLFLDRFDLGLLMMGFQCGAPAEETLLGMHNLPSELYPAYLRAAKRWMAGASGQ